MKYKWILALFVVCLLPQQGRAEGPAPSPMLVKAIARHESGLNPLAINVAGKSYYPSTREEAEAIIKKALNAGQSFDVGLMQVNSWWIKKYDIPPASLLDPERNTAWGTWILSQELARNGFNWQAVGKYHSPDAERGRQYAWRVYAAYAKHPPQASPMPQTTPRKESHARTTSNPENVSDNRGIQRNPALRPQGRLITFDIQQTGVPGHGGQKPGTRTIPPGTTPD